MANEFCKVSIHNHLGGRGADRTLSDSYDKVCNFDMDGAIKLIDEAKNSDFELIVLTQANRLPAEEYRLIREYGNNIGVCILPGVEINLKNEENKYLHTVVVFDDKLNAKEIEKKIDEYILKNKSNHLEMEQFLELIIDYKCIIATHGIKQNAEERSASTNPETFSELINISDSIPVVIEDNHKYHKITLKNQLRDKLTDKELEWIDKSATISAADRKSFKEIKSPTYIWGNPKFDDLYYSCFMSDTRIKRETDIITKVNYISRIEISNISNTQIQPETIICSHGLNSIIGASGSGKTLLLDIIKRKLTGNGIDNKTISKNCKYEDVYNLSQIHLYDSEGKELDKSSGYKIVEGEILYNKVISAYQSDKKTLLNELDLNVELTKVSPIILSFNNKLNEYIQHRKTIINNRKEINTLVQNIDSAEKFLMVNLVVSKDVIDYTKNNKLLIQIQTLNKQIESINADIISLEKNINSISIIGKKYNANTILFTDLESLKMKLKALIQKRLMSLKIQIGDFENTLKFQTVIFNSVLSYNNKIGSQFKAVSEKKQEILNNYNTILSDLLENVKLINTLKVPVLDEEEIKDAIQFDDKKIARLTFKSVKLEIAKDDFKEYFPSNIGNRPKLKVSLFQIDKLKLYDEESVKVFAEVFINNMYDERVEFVITNSNFIDYTIELKNLDGRYENIDSISAGNLSKIYINKMFEDKIIKAGSNTIVLYDQPDTNMEKAFILEELVSKLSNLRNSNQVFITTHEPLLVVNADSNNIIVAQNDKTASKSNDISYLNKSFVGVNSKKELISDVAKLIDGKPEAVQLRSKIYGGVLSEN